MTEPKKFVLYVDDEPKNLTSFKAVFRKHYQIYVAESAKEGLDLMEQHPIQLVITDQRMPNMTGVEFLEKIADKYPEVTRIILTGYSDAEAIIDAINKGRVYRYITKPWKKEDLMTTIDHAIESNQLRIQNKILIQNLQKTNQELDNFVYSAAHDLRAPVASILGLINLMRETEDIQVIKDYMEIQFKTIKKLDHFIRNIIDFSRNSHLELKNEPIEFSYFISSLIEEFRYYDNSEKVEKIIEIEQPDIFISDKVRLEIVFKNLISNSIRYSNLFEENPYIRIAIRVNEEEAFVELKDNGQGIHQEHLPKVFDMFYRATDHNVGSGLGLYIVKETLEKLGGKIMMQSEYSKGTTIQMTIPNQKKSTF